MCQQPFDSLAAMDASRDEGARVDVLRGRGGGGSCHVPATDRTYDTSVDIQYFSTRRWRAVYPDGL